MIRLRVLIPFFMGGPHGRIGRYPPLLSEYAHVVNHTLTITMMTILPSGWIRMRCRRAGHDARAVSIQPAFRTKFAKRLTAERSVSDWLVSDVDECDNRPATSPASAATFDTLDNAVLTCVVPASSRHAV